jgi:hypothetical protein
MARKSKSPKRDKPRERRERRFDPLPTVSPMVAYGLGWLGALVMGAAAWEQFGRLLTDSDLLPLKVAPYFLVGGSVLVAIAIWLGTSGEPPIRVGDGGIGLEKGDLRRMPWFAVERVEWRGEAVRVAGKDEAGAPFGIVATLATHPQAAAWIVKEARERVPSVVDVPREATLPEPIAYESIALEPAQVVGRQCVASGTVIGYEPDARICPRCERVYHKDHVPTACACGALLANLRASALV